MPPDYPCTGHACVSLRKAKSRKTGQYWEKTERWSMYVKRIMALISKVQCEPSDFFFFFMVGSDFFNCFIRTSTKVMSSLDWFHCVGLS